MGWEKRRGRLYYYTKERQGNRVVSRYVGAGEFSSTVVQMREIDADVLALLKWKWKYERDQLDNLEASIAASFCDAAQTFRHAMEMAGYRQHNRGEWRKKR